MKDALEFYLEGVLENGEESPMPRSLNYYVEQTDEISSDDIIAHVSVEIPEMALA